VPSTSEVLASAPELAHAHLPTDFSSAAFLNGVVCFPVLFLWNSTVFGAIFFLLQPGLPCSYLQEQFPHYLVDGIQG